MTEKMTGKIEAIEQKTAKNGNGYLKLTVLGKDGEHTYALFDSAKMAFESKKLSEGDWVEFSEAEDARGYRQLLSIQLCEPTEAEKAAIESRAHETAERIARTSALQMAVDIYNAGNIPASQLYETAEEYKRYILTGEIPEGVVE